MDDKNAIAYVVSGMGDLALDRGNLSEARKYYEEALGLRTQAGEKQTAAETRVSLAKLAIEEGHSSDAEASARMSQKQFHEDKEADDELNARIVLITALLTQGKQGEAEKEIEGARRLSQQSQNRFLRLQFELVLGRVLLESHRPETSGPLFQEVNRDAKRHGFVGLEFANELASAEFANKTRNATRSLIQLRVLQKTASAKGFELIARKARQQISE
jgi:tetratricopeptide (TPR) repeat protein